MEMDITPMIDCVFLLLIFFAVTFNPDEQTSLALPPAHNGVDISPQDSCIISVAFAGDKQPAAIYLAEGKVESARVTGDDAQQEEQIKRYVEEYARQGKKTVMIKVEKGVRYKDTYRVESAAGQIEGMELYLAVMFTD